MTNIEVWCCVKCGDLCTGPKGGGQCEECKKGQK